VISRPARSSAFGVKVTANFPSAPSAVLPVATVSADVGRPPPHQPHHHHAGYSGSRVTLHATDPFVTGRPK